MTKLEQFVDGLDTYREVAFDLLRIYLGIGLFMRGALFVLYPSTYLELLGPSSGLLASTGFLYAVAFTHIAGGAMMALGLLTRLAALVQIPILLGAVLFVHFQGGLFTADQSFEFSALVLFLLVLVFLHGSGRWSVDHYWQHRIRPFRRFVDGLDISGEVAFNLLRVYLGIGLFVRGVLFIRDSQAFMDLLGPTTGALLTSIALIHYVALAHLVGGAFMALGLLTRLAALVQIPILLGAVFLVHFQGGLLAPSQSFEFSVLVLFLLVLIFLYGSGRWSVDYYITRHQVAAEDEYAAQMRQVRASRSRSTPFYEGAGASSRAHLERKARAERQASLLRRPWRIGELASVSALVAMGLLLLVYLFVPITLSAPELLFIFLAVVFLSFFFASFYKKWAHSYRLIDGPVEEWNEETKEEERTGAPAEVSRNVTSET